MVLLTITAVHSQRMIPKQKAVEISTGILSNDKVGTDYYISVAMTINAKKGNYQLWGLEYSQKLHSSQSAKIPQETFTAEGGFSFLLLYDAQRTFTLNLGLTGAVGYERLNRGETILYDGAKMISKDNFIFGASGRLTLETYLSDQIVLFIQGRTRAYWNTDLEQLRPSLGLGLRFNF